jgi:hypothetical protein
MNTKICTKCGEEKLATLEFFYKQKRGKYGVRGECKSCVKIYEQQNKQRKRQYDKQYHENNKEKRSKIKKRYYRKNKEQISERHRQYRKENKEQIAESQKQWRQNNKEKIIKREKQYREANKEKISKRKKQYQQKNNHLFRQISAKYRAAKLNQTPDYANLDLIKLIYKNCPDGYEVDHINPISSGGLHHESNLCYLPEGINQSKGAKTIEEFGEEEFNKHVIYWQDYLTPF